MVLQTDVGLHCDLDAVVLGHLNGVLVHLIDVLILGGTVHPHPLDHHHGNPHLTGGDDGVLDALHALHALGGSLAETDKILADEGIKVDRLEGNAVLGGGFQIAFLNALVI